MMLFKWITDFTRGLARLTSASARAKDLTPVYRGPVDKIITEFVVEQFRTEGVAGGTAWAQLAPSTLAARQRPGHGRGGIGRDTNRMWASLVNSPSPEGYVRITPLSYQRGSNVPWEKWFSGGRQGQPARPVFPNPMPAHIRQRIDFAIAEYTKTGQLV